MVTGATFLTANSPSTPMQVTCMHRIPYTEVISSVPWPVVVSQPDAAFAVSILSQFVQNPGPAHWEAFKCTIIYLKSSKDLWLTFGRQSKPTAEGFCNVDWGGKKHHHSISGYSFHMGAGTILWSLKKQHVVVPSSTEVEYIVQMHMAKEGLWLCSFLQELCFTPNDLLILNCNNQGPIALAKDNKFHACTKHINVCYHFNCKAVEDRKIMIWYIPTGDNISNIVPSHLQKLNSGNSLSYSGCMWSHTRCKNSFYLHTLLAYSRGSVKVICNLHLKWYDLPFITISGLFM